MSFGRRALTMIPKGWSSCWSMAWIIGVLFAANAVLADGATFGYNVFPYPTTGDIPLRGGINDNGQIVLGSTGNSFLRQANGAASPIPPEPGSTIFSIIYAINNAGQMVGEAANPDHGTFRNSNGAYTDLPPGFAQTNGGFCAGVYPWGLNNVGQLVGNSCLGGFIAPGPTGPFQFFQCPNNIGSNPASINDRGQVVGFCGNTSNWGRKGLPPTTSFLRDTNGTITLITQSGWTSSEARGINNSGQIVGNYLDATGEHGFFRDTDGTISVLQGTVFGINNQGQVLGYTFDSTNAVQVYIASISNRTGVLSHIAAGGGWTTVITLVNTSSVAVPVAVALRKDDGNNLTLPVTTTQQGISQTSTTASVTATMNPNTTLLISTGDQVASTVVGWAEVTSPGPLGGYAIFRMTPQSGSPSEGTVPLQSQYPSTVTLPYDNTAGFVMGVALANLSTSTATITATMWDDSGNLLGTQNIVIAGSGHTAFVMPTVLSVTTGKRGIVKFQSGATGGLAGLGLRFSPFGTFTSVPTL
jgi:hypothetical protein